MTFIPIHLNVAKRRILVVGGGKVALHKLKTIVKFARNVTVVAPEIISGISRLNVRKRKEAYRKECLKGIHLVYACTDDRKVNLRVKKDAEKLNILANVADDIALCDFISPAVYKKRHMVVSVSSQGKDVRSAVDLRDRIKRQFDGDLCLRSRLPK